MKKIIVNVQAKEEEKRILKIINEATIPHGHFVCASNKHSADYIDKYAIYRYTKYTSFLCKIIAEHFAFQDPDVVIGPERGGIILSQWISYYLNVSSAHITWALFAEKSNDGKSFVIRRDDDKLLIAGENVLVVEDVINTGESVKKVVQAVRDLGGFVIGVGAICNRGNIIAQDIGDVPDLFSLVDMKLDSWNEADCLLCAQGIPINTYVGRGKEFLEQKKIKNEAKNKKD